MEIPLNWFPLPFIQPGYAMPTWFVFYSPKEKLRSKTTTSQEGNGDRNENPQSRNPIRKSHGHGEILQLPLRTLSIPWYLHAWSEPPSQIIGASETSSRQWNKNRREKRGLNILQQKNWNSAQPLWRCRPQLAKALHCRIPRTRKWIFASSRCQSTEKSSNWTSAPATDF
jgi:hypothetical protein